jgi:hypothetical protein
VVLQHYQQPLGDLAPGVQFLAPVVRGGCLGVEVFFTLSGFIVSYNYADRFRRFSRGAYRAFLWKWFARIYPVHLMTLAMMGALVLAADAMRMPLTSEARDTVETFTANRRGAGVARVPSVHMSSLVGGVRGGGMPRIPIASGVGGATASPPALISAAVVLGAEVLGVQLLAISGEFWTFSYPVMWLRINFKIQRGLHVSGLRRRLRVRDRSVRPPARDTAHRVGWPYFYSLYMTHFIIFPMTKKLVGWERSVAAPL